MKRHWLVHLVVLMLAGVACGANEENSPARPAAQKFTIEVDGQADGFSAGFSAFFPDHVAVHPGDTVTVKLNAASGQPHTATMGTLVDAAEVRLTQLGPQASLATQESTPEMLRLPDPFPHEVTGGPQDANQSAAQPCYLDTGVPPLSLTGGAPACPRREQPDFDGTQSFFSGGLLLAAGDAFTIRLASTIKPGTYSLMCMGHRSAGIGHITVVPADEPVPAPAEAAAEGRRQRQHLVDRLRPVAAQIDRATPAAALAGAVAPDVYNALVTQFGPSTISIPVGGAATWHFNGFHTVSFGAPLGAAGSLIKEQDGSVHLNPGVMRPAGYDVPDAAYDYPPPDGGQPVVIDGGQWDGVGFRSTGLIGSFPPVQVTLRQTFTKAGTYPYRCLFHPAMAGAVKVG